MLIQGNKQYIFKGVPILLNKGDRLTFIVSIGLGFLLYKEAYQVCVYVLYLTLICAINHLLL
ncbi:hypothetical protein D1864_07500 [Oceanobacillus picturae]|nr:hypothetical protein D1864_07500 [Oceanobacillus picturae]